MSKHVHRPTVTAGAAFNAGLLGALVGGVAEAAGSAAQVRAGTITRQQAVTNVAREAGTTGLATGGAVAVAGSLGLTGFASLAGIILVATGAKYALDSLLRPVKTSCCPAAVSPAAEEQPVCEAVDAAEKKTPARPRRQSSAKGAKKKATSADNAGTHAAGTE